MGNETFYGDGLTGAPRPMKISGSVPDKVTAIFGDTIDLFAFFAGDFASD